MKGFFEPSSWKSKERRRNTIAQCGKCGRHKDCFSPKMECTGKGLRKVLFVAESPGEDEDRQGVQLIGEPGQLLRKMLKSLKIDLDDCWKTNAVRCHAPDNKLDRKHIDCCQPNLLKTIKELRPKVIILLGKAAVNSVLEPLWKKDLGSLNRWVGWAIPLPEYAAWVCPTYHPSYLLRMGGDSLLEDIVKRHLKSAFEKEKEPVDFPSLSDLEKQVIIEDNPRMVKAMLRDLLKKKGRGAFDYETTGLKPEKTEQQIVSCSFCFEGGQSFAFRMKDEYKRLMSKILQNRDLKKIASNLKFEERWTWAKFGHGVRGWWWDTMLAAHILDNRPAITSIKFQSFIRLGIGDYSSHAGDYLKSDTPNGLNRILEMDEKDLLMYNGLDSLLEYKVAIEQRKEMGLE